MMKIKYLGALFITVILSVSCNKRDEKVISSDPIVINFEKNFKIGKDIHNDDYWRLSSIYVTNTVKDVKIRRGFISGSGGILSFGFILFGMFFLFITLGVPKAYKTGVKFPFTMNQFILTLCIITTIILVIFRMRSLPDFSILYDKEKDEIITMSIDDKVISNPRESLKLTKNGVTSKVVYKDATIIDLQIGDTTLNHYIVEKILHQKSKNK
jgi:hypothetical protein